MLLFKSNKAFTLIEIMIAMAILSVLALLTANSVQNTIALKRKVQLRLDINEQMRSAMRSIKQDVETAFHYRNYNIEVLTELRKEIQTAAQQKAAKQQSNPITGTTATPTPTPNQNQKPKTVSDILNEYLSKYKGEKVKTQFLGAKDEMHFTSLNHLRRYEDAQESNIMEVGYYLKNCRSLLKESQRSQCLWRRSTPYLDDKINEGGGSSVLLENIKSFSLSYYDTESQEWLDSWYSNEEGTEATKDKFPPAVKVNLEVEINGQKRKESMVIGIAFPNNKEKDNASASNQTNSP